MDYTNSSPGPRIATNGRVGVVLVSLYSWTAVAIGVAVTRFIIGLVHQIIFGLDDWMVLAGSVVYIGSTISWQYAVNGGLGQHFAKLSPQEISLYFKAVYAAQLLHIMVMALAKLSGAFLINRIAPQGRYKRFLLFGMIGLYTIYSIFAFCFQCGVSEPWVLNPPVCSQGGPMYSIIALNIISDVLLAVWIVPILRNLNIDRERRTTVAVLFGSRAIVPMVAVAQIWAVWRASRSTDPTNDMFELALLEQAVTSLSLILASLPRVKRLLGVAGSGLLDARISDREVVRSGQGTSSKADSIPLKLLPSRSTKYTTTVVSGTDNSGNGNKGLSDWHKYLAMGSRHDDHTSTSSLFERQAGVMVQEEVTIEIERRESD